MSEPANHDWNPGTYLRFRGLRLRPAIDLLNAVPDLPDGPIVDLGCGTGIAGSALKARFPGRELEGVDSSPAMSGKADSAACYDRLLAADVAVWEPETPPALIFSNALMQWLPSHKTLFPRLAQALRPGGTLAIQMPRQQREPSHELMRRLSGDMFPDRFDWSGWTAPVSDPGSYIALLSSLGEVSAWETIYYQRLAPEKDGHPVRAFTSATAGREIAERLSPAEQADFHAAYDAALAWAYPAGPGGEVVFPFRRLFLVLTLLG